jgi:hypothetical protein
MMADPSILSLNIKEAAGFQPQPTNRRSLKTAFTTKPRAAYLLFGFGNTVYSISPQTDRFKTGHPVNHEQGRNWTSNIKLIPINSEISILILPTLADKRSLRFEGDVAIIGARQATPGLVSEIRGHLPC